MKQRTLKALNLCWKIDVKNKNKPVSFLRETVIIEMFTGFTVPAASVHATIVNHFMTNLCKKICIQINKLQTSKYSAI